MSPETTEGREGFLHPYRIEGGVGRGDRAHSAARSSTRRNLAEQAELLAGDRRRPRAASIRKRRSMSRLTKQYRNMADGLTKEPRAVEFAEEAMQRAGLTPKFPIVRGGTDGSRLTELGLPTPNLSTGEHNLHSPLEWTCLEEMEAAVKVLVELAQVWGKEISAG